MRKRCPTCDKLFYYKDKRRIYCSCKCSSNDPERKKRLSERNKKLGIAPPHPKGKNHPRYKGAKKTISCLYCGKKFKAFVSNNRKFCSQSCANKARKVSTETREKMRRTHKNRFKNHFHLTPLNARIRSSFEYRKWRTEVFERGDYTCQCCGVRGLPTLVAHHIESFSKILKKHQVKTFEEATDCKELWDVNNGITLCEECHELTDSYPNNLL